MTVTPLEYAFVVCWALPLPLLGFAWTRPNRQKISIVVLSFSAVLILSAGVRYLKFILLGEDYSNRLYTTIGVNMLVAIILALYLAITRRWLAALAAAMLALAWFWVCAVNSVV
jgi:hypothetical protein